MYIPLVVDNAYTCDSRIKKFKEDEKERKLAEKKAKEDAARAAAEEKERVSIDTLWPFIRGKIRPVLHKTRLK